MTVMIAMTVSPTIDAMMISAYLIIVRIVSAIFAFLPVPFLQFLRSAQHLVLQVLFLPDEVLDRARPAADLPVQSDLRLYLPSFLDVQPHLSVVHADGVVLPAVFAFKILFCDVITVSVLCDQPRPQFDVRLLSAAVSDHTVIRQCHPFHALSLLP